MLKRKCPGCAEKIEKRYPFCPWCGESIRREKEMENFGLLGRNDNNSINELSHKTQLSGLPFGLDKMVGPLIKQLEKELSNMEKQNGNMPKGFNIKIHTGHPGQMMPHGQIETKEAPKQKISAEEQERRQNLPKKEAESKVKRLSDKIIYEITTPGVKEKKDIAITKLEQGFEIKAYTDDYCYTKIIPFQVEITDFFVKKDQLVVELKN